MILNLIKINKSQTQKSKAFSMKSQLVQEINSHELAAESLKIILQVLSGKSKILSNLDTPIHTVDIA